MVNTKDHAEPLFLLVALSTCPPSISVLHAEKLAFSVCDSEELEGAGGKASLKGVT